MQPGGRIILVMTRWSKKDLTEMLLQSQAEEKADKWDIVEFPAIMPSVVNLSGLNTGGSRTLKL